MRQTPIPQQLISENLRHVCVCEYGEKISLTCAVYVDKLPSRNRLISLTSSVSRIHTPRSLARSIDRSFSPYSPSLPLPSSGLRPQTASIRLVGGCFLCARPKQRQRGAETPRQWAGTGFCPVLLAFHPLRPPALPPFLMNITCHFRGLLNSRTPHNHDHELHVTSRKREYPCVCMCIWVREFPSRGVCMCMCMCMCMW